MLFYYFILYTQCPTSWYLLNFLPSIKRDRIRFAIAVNNLHSSRILAFMYSCRFSNTRESCSSEGLLYLPFQHSFQYSY